MLAKLKLIANYIYKSAQQQQIRANFLEGKAISAITVTVCTSLKSIMQGNAHKYIHIYIILYIQISFSFFIRLL